MHGARGVLLHEGGEGCSGGPLTPGPNHLPTQNPKNIPLGNNEILHGEPEMRGPFEVPGGGGGIVKRFFFGMAKIKGVKNRFCSLEMKEKFGMRPLVAAS